jgi:hypothetical protein
MSKSEYIKSLEKEIRKVNRIIDIKILQGKNYFIESRRHKFLKKQMNQYAGQTGLLTRIFSFF